MFDRYHYTQIDGQLIYLALINVDKGQMMSLYKDGEMLDRDQGFLGSFVLEKEEYKVDIKNTALKSTHSFYHNGKKVELEKIKHKDLKAKLTQKGIFNDVNPTKEELDSIAIKTKDYMTLLTFMGVGLLMIYLGRNINGIKYLFFVPSIIGGFIFYGALIKRFPSFGTLRKGALGFALIVGVIVGLLGQLLFGISF